MSKQIMRAVALGRGTVDDRRRCAVATPRSFEKPSIGGSDHRNGLSRGPMGLDPTAFQCHLEAKGLD